MSYKLFNETDGVYADPRTFSSMQTAYNAKVMFLERFERQGYYLTADGHRIEPEDVDLVIEEV